jgi:hypothetical protein
MAEDEYKKHDRSYFYKYTSAHTAKLILRKKTLRYSSPILFNDPFDIQTELLFDFDIDNLPKLVMNEIEKIVLYRKKVELDERHEWSRVIALLKEKVEAHGYYRDEVRALIVTFLNMLAQLLEETRKKYNAIWRNHFLPRLRVFSVSEINDSILMWSHYAEYHTGAVFKLNVLPDLDNPLCVARPVIYKPKPPTFFTVNDWLDEFVGVKLIDPEKLYWEYAYIKSDIWSYEREWRVWDLLPEMEPEMYSDYPICPEEIETIYFGCKIQGS